MCRHTSRLVLYMSMSLVGVIAGQHDREALLGRGRRLFEALGREHIEPDLVRPVEGRDVTHLRYRGRH